MRDDVWIIDPDHRYKPFERANGPIKTRKMTKAERKKYADVKPSKPEPVYFLKDSDIERVQSKRKKKVG